METYIKNCIRNILLQNEGGIKFPDLVIALYKMLELDPIQSHPSPAQVLSLIPTIGEDYHVLSYYTNIGRGDRENFFVYYSTKKETK